MALIRRSFVLLLLMSLLPGGAAMAARRNWAATVSATAAGGYLIGNPKAPVKMIEYFSLTCPHCRHFAEEAMAPLRERYLTSGKVSLELRNYVLNSPDLAASVLMRCGTPMLAVRLYDRIYAEQRALFSGAYTLPSEAIDRIDALPIEQRPAALAREAGLMRWFAANGLPEEAGKACLADQKRQERLIALRQGGESQFGVEGTPGFVINGARIDGVTWAAIEPAIKAALAK